MNGGNGSKREKQHLNPLRYIATRIRGTTSRIISRYYRMRYNRQRRDNNHKAIVKALRSVGAKVKDTSQLGGFVDLVVSFRGAVFLLECKNSEMSPAQKKLTPAEQKFHDEWGDVARIVETVDEALLTIGAKITI